MSEQCAITDNSRLAGRNRDYGKQAIELINGLKKDGYLSDVDSNLATILLKGCDTYFNKNSYNNLLSKINLTKSTPIDGIFSNEEEKKAAFRAEFKKVISGQDDGKKIGNTVEEDIQKGNVNSGWVTFITAIGNASDVACGRREYLKPPTLTEEQKKNSTVLPGVKPVDKDGTLANLVRAAEGKPLEEQIEIWKTASEKAESNFTKLKDPSEEYQNEHTEALRLKTLADSLLQAGNKSFALEYYKQSMSAQPSGVFPLN